MSRCFLCDISIYHTRWLFYINRDATKTFWYQLKQSKHVNWYQKVSMLQYKLLRCWVYDTSFIIFENVDITREAKLRGWYQHSRIWYHSWRIPNYRDNVFVNRSASQQRAERIKVKEVCNKTLLNKNKIILCLPFCEFKKNVVDSSSFKGREIL